MDVDRLRPILSGSILMTIGLVAGITGVTEYIAFLNGFRGSPIGIQVVRFTFFLFTGVLLVMLGWVTGTDQSAS